MSLRDRVGINAGDPTRPAPFEGILNIPEFYDRALCAQTDPEAYFPEKGGSTRSAKAICMRCPVRQECRDYALANRIREGIWGGLSDRERRQLEVRLCRDCGVEIPRQKGSPARCADCRAPKEAA